MLDNHPPGLLGLAKSKQSQKLVAHAAFFPTRAVLCCRVHCCLQAPAELSVIVSQLQRVQPHMMADTVAMADALEALTVTRWEAWAGLLMELSLETNRKLLSLRVCGTC